MQTIRILQKSDNDGALRLLIPVGIPDREYEVVLVLQPKQAPSEVATPDELGWPPGYFEQTFGSIDDETFFRHPQGELPKPVEFD